MHHDLDHDACCIHCGMDAADIPRRIIIDGEIVQEGERMPPCPIWDAETRRRNFVAWQAQAEEEWDMAVDDPEPIAAWEDDEVMDNNLEG